MNWDGTEDDWLEIKGLKDRDVSAAEADGQTEGWPRSLEASRPS
jgi:hypothetical protein